MTSWRALKMSTLSSKVATTCDNPNFEIDRALRSPGRPLMASSTGWVICASVSCGLSAAAVVLICTCTGVVSGKASMGKMLKARPPMTSNPSARTPTKSRFLRDDSIIQLSMASLSVGVRPSHPRTPRPGGT